MDRPRHVRTVTPDMIFPTSSALLADEFGMRDAAAYDLLAGAQGSCMRSPRHTGCSPLVSRSRAVVVGGDVLSKILDWDDRSTLVLFGDGAGAVVMERVEPGGFLASSSARTEPAASTLLPGQRLRRRRRPGDDPEDERARGLQVRHALMVSSARAVLEQGGLTMDDVDLYIPHQANTRILDHA